MPAPVYLTEDTLATWKSLDAARVRAEVPESQPFLLPNDAGVTEQQLADLVALGAASVAKTDQGPMVTLTVDDGTTAMDAGTGVEAAAKPTTFSGPTRERANQG